jgi:hypothetical protein
MNNHGKMIYNTKVDGMKSMGDDVSVGVYGIFTSNSGTGKWKYYLLSYKTLSNGDLRLTNEWHLYPLEATYDTIQKHAKEVQSVEDGRKICDEYKSKWISGSNDTLQHKREEKLNEILDK